MRYPKINTVWKRLSYAPAVGKKVTPIIEGEYSDSEFSLIEHWHVEEKYEGMNVRVSFCHEGGPDLKIVYAGRQEISELPDHVLDYMKSVFTQDKLLRLYGPTKEWMTFHMEVIGPKIQGNYYNLPELKLVLFDVQMMGAWFDRKSVYQFAEELGIIRPNVYGEKWDINQIVEFIKSKPSYKKQDVPDGFITIEGVVCRGSFNLDGKAIHKIMKLKCKDYK